VPRPGDSEETFLVFESSFHPYYQYNHSKVEAIPLSALPEDEASKLAGLSSQFTLSLFNAECQAGKLSSSFESDVVCSMSVIPLQYRSCSICMSFVRLGHQNG